MGNTTSMKEAYAHKHGDMMCTMKHGKRRHHRTAKHKGRKHSGKKHTGKKYRRSRRKYSGGVMMSLP